MIIKDDKDLEGMKRAGAVVRESIAAMQAAAVPGITTIELDLIGKRVIESYGAQSAPKLTYNFPGYTCISVNDEVAHGIPAGKILDRGDIVNVDVSVELNGYWADAGASFGIPPVKMKAKRLISTTKFALRSAIAVVRVGQPLSVIGKAIEKAAKPFYIIKNLASHGVGSSLHEYPTEILSYFDPKETRLIEEGMVFTIEPFLTTEGDFVANRGQWALVNPYRTAINAQFEHTIIALKEGALVVT